MRNYKSIEEAFVELGPLTLLVGRNGTGKSNVIDALRFFSDALNNDLGYAIRERGGIDEVRRRSLGGRPTHPGLGVELSTDAGRASYSFRLAAVAGGAFRVDKEACEVTDDGGEILAQFKTNKGHVSRWTMPTTPPPVADDRLYLTSVAGYPEFAAVADVLKRMTFHDLNPQAMRYPVRPEPGDRLTHDGRNLPSVVRRLQAESPAQLERVNQYLNAIGVPVRRIEHRAAASLETIRVAMEVPVPQGSRNLTFDAIALSDGTLRALGILVSIFSGHGGEGGPTLVAVEEPETALHPAAVGALVDALLEGAETTQTLVTCHSPDLLSHDAIDGDRIRIVLLDDAKTVIGPLDPSKLKLLRDHLFDAGELLRLDQLAPDREAMNRQKELAGTLFEAVL